MSQSDSRTYVAIDLKSFYASVECVERGLDPLTTNLVVADVSRTDKTICLAVSPSLKSYGIPGRARLFEVNQILRRYQQTTGQKVEFIAAPPQMALYIQYSSRIYSIYLHYVAEEDIHSYSIDEVFMDMTEYLTLYNIDVYELVRRITNDILTQTGITATVGIGTNLYLAKVAMDIVAKHAAPDQNGLRIGRLDEQTYRETLWDHKPLTSFWRVGHGIARRLEQYGIDTMGKLARASIQHESWLYHQFGINAELLIDHAWGYEPVEMRHIKSYKSETQSLSSGQVLSEPYSCSKARTVILEMADNAVLELIEKRLLTNQLTLTINYDQQSLNSDNEYTGPVTTDHYGRCVPKHSQGTIRLGKHTASTREIMAAVAELFDRIINDQLLVRRLNLTMNNVIIEGQQSTQLSLFDIPPVTTKSTKNVIETPHAINPEKERKLQEIVLKIKHRYGKNALLRGLNYDEGATAKQRNNQIGGHQA